MLNEQLSILGLPEEWRPLFYKNRLRPRADSEIYILSDPAMLKKLADCHSPKLELWRAVLRLWRVTKIHRLEAKREESTRPGRRRSKLTKPVYDFDYGASLYQMRLNNDDDFELVRHLGYGVTIMGNNVRIARMNPSEVILQAITGRKLSEIVEMKHDDLADYGDAIIGKVRQRGEHLHLTLEGYENLSRTFDFYVIEPLLEKQDKDQARKSA